MKRRTALITGAAGFIGFHLSARLLEAGWQVVGIDSLNTYYDVGLKQARLAQLQSNDAFVGISEKIETPGVLSDVMARYRPEHVVHLAAQAGVRYSIENPRAYFEANLAGTFELLEAARAHPPAHMLLASTSSAYGTNTVMPYAETQKADHQVSFYAATKKATEAMAHSYAHLFGLPTTMFRFFTVYGPWGRPDMAPHLFVSAILEGRPIKVFNHGDMKRDFTYIDDLVGGIIALSEAAPGDTPVGPMDSLSPVAPFRVVNIGNGAPVPLPEFIAALETAAGQEAIREMHPMQPGDVPATWAATDLLEALTGTRPTTPVTEGAQKFVAWYRSYYKNA